MSGRLTHTRGWEYWRNTRLGTWIHPSFCQVRNQYYSVHTQSRVHGTYTFLWLGSWLEQQGKLGRLTHPRTRNTCRSGRLTHPGVSGRLTHTRGWEYWRNTRLGTWIHPSFCQVRNQYYSVHTQSRVHGTYTFLWLGSWLEQQGKLGRLTHPRTRNTC